VIVREALPGEPLGITCKERTIAFHHGLPVPDRLEKLMGATAGSHLNDPAHERSGEVLTPAALDFVARLYRGVRHPPTRPLAAREHRYADPAGGGTVAPTAEILDASIRGVPHRGNPEPRVPTHRGG
jgi:hypothetical protein